MIRRTHAGIARHLRMSATAAETNRRTARMGRSGAAHERDLAMEALATGRPQIGHTDPGAPRPWALIGILDAELGITTTHRYPTREAAEAALTERTAHA